ncbi:MAG: hypothetical protein H6679_00315 [Epsilonproteobacteria bacterium]|nr:hypothetical protein [Campylobacterota bacterium]
MKQYRPSIILLTILLFCLSSANAMVPAPVTATPPVPQPVMQPPMQAPSPMSAPANTPAPAPVLPKPVAPSPVMGVPAASPMAPQGAVPAAVSQPAPIRPAMPAPLVQPAPSIAAPVGATAGSFTFDKKILYRPEWKFDYAQNKRSVTFEVDASKGGVHVALSPQMQSTQGQMYHLIFGLRTKKGPISVLGKGLGKIPGTEDRYPILAKAPGMGSGTYTVTFDNGKITLVRNGQTIPWTIKQGGQNTQVTEWRDPSPVPNIQYVGFGNFSKFPVTYKSVEIVTTQAAAPSALATPAVTQPQPITPTVTPVAPAPVRPAIPAAPSPMAPRPAIPAQPSPVPLTPSRSALPTLPGRQTRQRMLPQPRPTTTRPGTSARPMLPRLTR